MCGTLIHQLWGSGDISHLEAVPTTPPRPEPSPAISTEIH